MSIETLTWVLFAAFFICMFSGIPIAFSLAGIAMLFSIFQWGPQGLLMSFTATYMTMDSFILIAIPMFIFMALVLEKSGVAEQLYKTIGIWAGGLNGGLAIGTVLVCTIIAAMVGIIGAGIVTATIFALPSMSKHGYDKHLSYGTIMAGGCLGTLIPPSVQMVVYAAIAQQSVGGMLMGGVLPGLLLSGLFVIYIVIRTALNPSLGPGLPPEERAGWKEKIISIKNVILPILIVLSVLGVIFFGIATPTEGGGVGCVSVLIATAIHRRLSWTLLKDVVQQTAKLFGMVFWILIGAACFNQFYIAMGAVNLFKGVILGANLHPWVVLIMMQMALIVLGVVMEDLAIMVIAGPIFTSIIVSLGFDPLWFGVLFIMNMQIAMLSPPTGFTFFYIKTLIPNEKMTVLYRSALPFLILQVIGLALCMAFPNIILWLPHLMVK